jgi:hypothetical protein
VGIPSTALHPAAKEIVMRVILLGLVICCPLLVFAASSGKPRLYVIESESCGPCRVFCEHWSQTPGFAATLRSAFDVRGLHWENPEQQRLAQQLGVSRLPAFVVVLPNGRQYEPIIGFTTPNDLLQRLRLPLLPATSEKSSKSKSQPRSETSADDTSRQEIRRLESSIETLRKQLQSLNIPADQSTELQALRKTLEDLQSAGERSPGPVDISTEMPAAGGLSLGSKLPGGLMTFAVKAAAAIALPEVAIPAGAMSLGATAFGWWLGRRRRRTGPVTSMSDQSRVVPIAVESPPPPQFIHTETRFVDVERDTHAQAHAWAVAELVRKYPGAAGFAETLQSLITQFMNAKGKP